MHSHLYAVSLTVHMILQCTTLQAFPKPLTSIEHACIPKRRHIM